MQGNLHVRFLGGGVHSNVALLPDQTLEGKARFIAQVIKGSFGARAAEDVELAALSYAEVKALASGNPLVMEKAGIDAELAKLSALKSVWYSESWGIKREVEQWLPNDIKLLSSRISGLTKDVAVVEQHRGKKLVFDIAGKRYDDREEGEKALLRHAIEALRATKNGNVHQIIGEVAGFKLGIYSTKLREFPNYYLDGASVEHHARSMKSGSGICEAIAAAIHSIPTELEEAEYTLSVKEQRLASLATMVDRKFEHEDRMQEVLKRQYEVELALGLHKDSAGAMDAEEKLAA